MVLTVVTFGEMESSPMKRSMSAALLQHSTPKRSPLSASSTLADAPVDVDFGEQGYARLLKQEARSIGVCTDVLKSRTRPDRYYACAFQANRDTLAFNSGIWLLDGNGQRDETFTVDFSTEGENGKFEPHSLMEDANGNLLCLGSNSDGPNRLWRFNKAGKPDPNFAGSGFVDSDQLLAERLHFRFAATMTDGYVIACHTPEFNTVLVALSHDGKLNQRFGEAGVLHLEPQLPGYGAGINSLVVATHLKRESILLLSMRGEGDAIFSLLSSINNKGVVDTSFGEQGHVRSENATLYRGVSIGEASSLITLCGGHMFEDGSMQPQMTRLTATGRPDEAFNAGIPVRFDAAGGMWHHIHEVEDSLMGVGSFFTHNRAVRYLTNGKLDTTFVPPLGYGSFGALAPNPGFYMDGNSSIAFVSTAKRMLVCGEVNAMGPDRVDAVVLALAVN